MKNSFVAISIFLLGSTSLFLYVNLRPTPAKAAGSNDVQYSTVLDYSSTNALIETSGFTASTTYNCSIATQFCTYVPSSQTTLLPTSLAGLGGSTTYASPDYTMALVSFTENQVPTAKLYSVQYNTPTLVTTVPSLNSGVRNVHWSGNDAVLIITELDGSIQKFDTTTNTLTNVKSTLPDGASWITVSPDGRYIAYYVPAIISTGERTFGIIDTKLDTSYTLQEHIGYWDLLTEGVRIFAFSPDSTHLLYLDDRSGYQTLYNVNLSKLPTKNSTSSSASASVLAGTQITTKPYAIGDMQWENTSTILFTANRTNPLQWSLYELNLNTYALNKITDWVAAYDQPMQTFGSNVLFETADANGRLVKVFNTVSKAVSGFQLPYVNQSIIGSANQVISNKGIYSVYMPATTATTTLLVWLHGGPDRQSAIEYNSYMSYGGYDWVLNKIQAAGVPVLKIDYPGSVGQSYAFASSVKNGVGTTDSKETMAAINAFASTHGFKNIYLMGNSYGGYLGLKMLVTYPSQIKGMLALSAVTNWEALISNIPTSIFSLDFNGSPNSSNQSLYNASSIMQNLGVLTNQKVIVVQGDQDNEVPYQQSTLLNQAFNDAGKSIDYITLPGENHVYEKPVSYTVVCNKAFELVGLPVTQSCVMH